MTPLNIPGIGNGYKVDALVWRGAQPEPAAWPLLAAAGCRTILDLNSSGDAIREQDRLIAPAGMLYYALDWSGFWPPPSLEKVQRAMALIDAMVTTSGTPVFVHCQHGSDRTGVVCACWRIHHDGWDFDDAMHEAFTSLGFQGLHEFWMAAAVAHYAHSLGRLGRR